MKFEAKSDLQEFLNVVDQCKGDVLLRSVDGDSFNLKSLFSKYIAIGELLGEHGDELELFCMDKEDEPKFFQFFKTHNDVLQG